MDSLHSKIKYPSSKKDDIVWNKNFYILWQAQFISAFGDAIYEIGVGFWILAQTGSTALMSLTMISMLIPKVITGLFAGIWVDRLDRKKLIVTLELIRGVIIVLLGVVTLNGYGEIWMFVACGIVLGICAAFFNPSVNSILPDIISQHLLIKANSLYEIASYSTMLIGNVSGGIIYAVIGAPIMFLVNGISFCFSGIMESYMVVPKLINEKKKINIMKEFKSALTAIWGYKGLKYILITYCLSNFFLQSGYILLMPLFKAYKNLGVVRYGFCMGAIMVGMLIGVLLLSKINIRKQRRYIVFLLSGIISMTNAVIAPIIINFYVTCVCLFLFGVFNSISNILFKSSIQMIVSQNSRGKVFSMISTLTGILTPLGMILGGTLSTYFGVRKIMVISFSLSLLLTASLILFKDAKEIFCQDYSKEFEKI